MIKFFIHKNNVGLTQTDEIRVFLPSDLGEAVRAGTASRGGWKKNAKIAVLRKSHNGYITLLSVLVVAAVGMAIAVSLLLLGVGASRTSFALEQSHQAKALTNACVEEALETIRETNLFSGTTTLAIGAGSCSFGVSLGAGEIRRIFASSTVWTITRKASTTVSAINPAVIVVGWQEIP